MLAQALQEIASIALERVALAFIVPFQGVPVLHIRSEDFRH